MPKGTLIRAPFGLGEDNASDPLTLPPGKLAQATNVAFDTKGALIKKPGAFQLGANDQAGNPVANQGALVTFRGELGRIIDSGAFYGYQQGGAFWQDRNSPAPAFVAERQAVLKTLPSGYAFGQVASTVVGGYMLMATQQAEFVGNIITLYSIDLVSGRATQLLSTGGSAPCVVSGGGSFAFLVYINELAGDVGDIKYVAFNSATGEIGSSTSLGISMVSGYLATQLDACMTSATELAVAWEAASSGTPYQANLFAWGGSSFTTGTNTSMTLAIGASLRMSFLPTNGYLAITTAVSLISGDTGTPAIKYEVLNASSLSAVVGGHSSNLPAISSGQPPNFQGLRAEPIEVYGDGANHFEIIVEATFNFDMTEAGNNQSYPGGFAMWPNYLLKFKTDYTAGQGSTSWTKLHQGLGLASTPIADSTTGQNIMLACSGSALQPTLYLVNDSGRVLSNIAQGVGGGYRMTLPAPNSGGSCVTIPNPRLVYDPNIANGYRVCALTQANLEAQNGTLIS